MREKRKKQPASLWEVVNRERLKKSQEKVNEDVRHGHEVPSVKVEKPVAPIMPERKISPFFQRKKRKFKLSVDFKFFKRQFSGIKLPNKNFVIIALIVLIIVVFVAFKIGSPDNEGAEPIASQRDAQTSSQDKRATLPFIDDQAGRDTTQSETTATADSEKDHVIVITSYNVSKDLEPVKRYFDQKNVSTEIYKPDGSIFYMLITSKIYESPRKKGSDGYFALENIKRIGADYKAPKGYETFGSVPFQDAYGMKFSK